MAARRRARRWPPAACPPDIDLVIVATCSTESSIPNTAAVVAHRLGILAPGAYDLNAACAGFCYALANAADAVKAGSARHVLVIGSEKMTAWIDPDKPRHVHHLRGRSGGRGGRPGG